MKGWSRRGSGESSGDIGRAALLGGVVGALLASSVAVVAAATTMELGPKVGDILVFRSNVQVPADWDFTAASIGGEREASCNLKPNTMAAGGGSLVVEERFRHPLQYRVHWAGRHTSDGNADCGGSAELVITGEELQLLSNAVGGPGVEHQGLFNF